MSTVFLLDERILHPTNDERKTAAEGGVNEGKPPIQSVKTCKSQRTVIVRYHHLPWILPSHQANLGEKRVSTGRGFLFVCLFVLWFSLTWCLTKCFSLILLCSLFSEALDLTSFHKGNPDRPFLSFPSMSVFVFSAPTGADLPKWMLIAYLLSPGLFNLLVHHFLFGAPQQLLSHLLL